MSDVNKQLLEALKELRDAYQEYMGLPACKANAAIAAAEQVQQITDNTRVAWTSLGTVKAMLPELLASDDVEERETAQVIDALVKLVGCQQQAEPVTRDVLMAFGKEVKKACSKAWGNADDGKEYAAIRDCDISAIVDRYAAQPPAVAVPDGYALVPVEPTDNMFIDGMAADCLGRPSIDDETHVRGIWRAMLAAAQKGGA